MRTTSPCSTRSSTPPDGTPAECEAVGEQRGAALRQEHLRCTQAFAAVEGAARSVAACWARRAAGLRDADTDLRNATAHLVAVLAMIDQVEPARATAAL